LSITEEGTTAGRTAVSSDRPASRSSASEAVHSSLTQALSPTRRADVKPAIANIIKTLSGISQEFSSDRAQKSVSSDASADSPTPHDVNSSRTKVEETAVIAL